jgi:hypothetical protein
LAVVGGGRTCGGCKACCSVLSVEEEGKPGGCDCRHLAGGGCGVYRDRPFVCRHYTCAWLAGHGTEADRPDRSGLLLSLGSDHEGNHLAVFELERGALFRRYTLSAEWLDRFLADLSPGLVGLIESGGLQLIFYPYGVPRVCEVAARPPYRPARYGKDDYQNFIIARGPMRFQMGVVDWAGNYHNGQTVVPAPDFEAARAKLLDGLNALGRLFNATEIEVET